MLLALLVLGRAPETIRPQAWSVSLRQLLRVPSAAHRRFRGVVAPSAPWVFAAPAIAFAVLPGLVATQTGGFEVGFAALIAGFTLTLGVLIQPIARRLDSVDDVRGTTAGLTAIAGGTLLGALAAHLQSWPLVIPAAGLLGCGYGLSLVSGLLEIQRLATREDLASLTAIYYALTYVGFAAPIVLVELERLASAPILLALTALLILVTIAAVRRASGPPI
jgi:hypothetical protein